MDKKKYDKVYNNCMYLARKELVARHNVEFKQILDKVMLDNGIITRRVSKDNKHKFTELCREQVEVTQ